MVLADLGAEVIKVEHPHGGDDTRKWGPPYVEGMSTYFLCANRNKKSIAVDFSTVEGQRIIRSLAAVSDVLVENYRLGSLEKFRLGYADLAADHPRLIYCSISGYGRTSPSAARPGYDFVMQAEGGLMSVTGDPAGAPTKVGVAVTDLFTGMTAVQAILGALIARDRDGRGQQIDIALFDCQLAMLANVGSAFLGSGEEPGRYGNAHPTVVPYQTFHTADGEIAIAIGNDGQFGILCESVLGRADIHKDYRFATNSGRVQNRQLLLDIIEPLFMERSTCFWQSALHRAGLPVGAVRGVGAALTSPEAFARDMVKHVMHPKGTRLSLVSSPLRLARTPAVEPTAPPLLGQHTEKILTELLGYDRAHVARLSAAGVVGLGESSVDGAEGADDKSTQLLLS